MESLGQLAVAEGLGRGLEPGLPELAIQQALGAVGTDVAGEGVGCGNIRDQRGRYLAPLAVADDDAALYVDIILGGSPDAICLPISLVQASRSACGRWAACALNALIAWITPSIICSPIAVRTLQLRTRGSCWNHIGSQAPPRDVRP